MMSYKKIPRVTNKELLKWIGILGAYRMKWLYIDGKIYLTSEQLDLLIEEGKKQK